MISYHGVFLWLLLFAGIQLKRICGKMWNILNSLTSKQNFYKVQSRRLAFSNPSLSSLSQSLTCTASGWDGCFRVSPNSITQINFFSCSWTFSSKFYKNYLLDVPRCAYCEDDDNILQAFYIFLNLKEIILLTFLAFAYCEDSDNFLQIYFYI